MAHIAKKVKKGRTYYYIRELARVHGKPKVVNQIYLGSIERIMDMALGRQEGGLKRIQVQEFGSLFLAHHVEKHVNVARIIDSVLPAGPRDQGPTLGEYFLYAIFNRMIEPRSKMGLAGWYNNFAVHQVRPLDTSALTSQRFWEKWDRVDQEAIEDISRRFFTKISELENIDSNCFLFDTTNYFHYMDSKTSSELAARGRSKDGKHWLRQIGLALLVSRGSQIPLFYREFEGNCHDSRLFNRLLQEILDTLQRLNREETELTVVTDKGMNSEENMETIDRREGVHFITTYSVAFAEDLARKDLSFFQPVDTAKNRELARKGRAEDQIVAWRTAGHFWGQERSVVVTYNPRTAAKQRYKFDKKLARLQDGLFEMRSKVRAGQKHWASKAQVMQRYRDLCDSLYLPQNLYDLEFGTEKNRLQMYFRKNHYRIGKHVARFGKNIIVTSHLDWTTCQIVQASLDRYQVEHSFRQSKAGEFGNFRPTWHWTDSKLRCHFFCCVVALTYLNLIRLWLHRSGVEYSADHAMDSMRKLASCLCWHGDKRKPVRMIEEPDSEQAQILKALGYKVEGGVLQSL
jgi:transposase